jgi:hypothetical protein
MKYLIVFLSVSASAWSQQLPVVQAVSFTQDTFNILTYGTKADDVSPNTSAIAQAISTSKNIRVLNPPAGNAGKEVAPGPGLPKVLLFINKNRIAVF